MQISNYQQIDCQDYSLFFDLFIIGSRNLLA